MYIHIYTHIHGEGGCVCVCVLYAYIYVFLSSDVLRAYQIDTIHFNSKQGKRHGEKDWHPKAHIGEIRYKNPAL